MSLSEQQDLRQCLHNTRLGGQGERTSIPCSFRSSSHGSWAALPLSALRLAVTALPCCESRGEARRKQVGYNLATNKSYKHEKAQEAATLCICVLYPPAPLPCCLCWCAQVTDKEIYLVVNAGCREKDLEHIGKHLKAAKVCGCVLVQALTECLIAPGSTYSLHESASGSDRPAAVH